MLLTSSSSRPPSTRLALPPGRCARRPARGGACAAASDDAEAWLSRWKKRVSEGAPPPPPSAAPEDGVDPGTAFRYVFVGGVSPAAHGFSLLILRDALEPAGVELYAPAPEASPSPWSLSVSLRELERVTPDDGRPLRLIGASTGALVAALFAERHPDRVDSLFLLSPTFNLRACLERAVGGERGLAVWRSQGVAKLDGRDIDFSALADIDSHSAYPFVRCRAYVAHGSEDGFAAAEESLTWVRQASVNMRRRGMPEDAVPERRLLEVNDDHALSRSVPALVDKVLSWHGLSSVGNSRTPPAVDLEQGGAEDADDHSANFIRYRAWLRSQGIDPDVDMK